MKEFFLGGPDGIAHAPLIHKGTGSGAGATDHSAKAWVVKKTTTTSKKQQNQGGQKSCIIMPSSSPPVYHHPSESGVRAGKRHPRPVRNTHPPSLHQPLVFSVTYNFVNGTERRCALAFTDHHSALHVLRLLRRHEERGKNRGGEKESDIFLERVTVASIVEAYTTTFVDVAVIQGRRRPVLQELFIAYDTEYLKHLKHRDVCDDV